MITTAGATSSTPTHLDVGEGEVEVARVPRFGGPVERHVRDARHHRVVHTLRQVVDPLLVHIHLLLRHLQAKKARVISTQNVTGFTSVKWLETNSQGLLTNGHQDYYNSVYCCC